MFIQFYCNNFQYNIGSCLQQTCLAWKFRQKFGRSSPFAPPSPAPWPADLLRRPELGGRPPLLAAGAFHTCSPTFLKGCWRVDLRLLFLGSTPIKRYFNFTEPWPYPVQNWLSRTQVGSLHFWASRTPLTFKIQTNVGRCIPRPFHP